LVAAYGSYRLAQWYWKEDDGGGDDEFEEGTEHPLEEDLPSFFAQEEHTAGGGENNSNHGNRNGNYNNNNRSSNHRPSNNENNSSNYSWLSTAAVGVASWLADAGTASPTPTGGGFASTRTNTSTTRASAAAARARPPPTRRQQLVRCRRQSRVAFQTCFQTLKPVLENLTDSSRQTKELKGLRRRRQALKEQQQQQQQSAQEEHGESDGDACTGSDTTDGKKHYERELRALQEREKDLWREVLVETTTRMMVSSYAYALLLLSLTVQFHWLASTSKSESGFLQNDSSDEQQQEKQQREQEALLMRSHRYFLNEGIPLLVTTVRRSVERVCFGDDNEQIVEVEEILGGRTTQTTNDSDESSSSRRWRNPSSQFVSSEDVEQTLYHELPRVLDDVGMGGRQGRRRRRRRNWIRFVLPDEEEFDPLWDICRSPVWEDAQEQVLGCLWYKVLRDGESNGSNPNNDRDSSSHGWGKIFRTNGNTDGSTSTTHSDDNGRKKLQKQQQQQLPLAKVMAHFKKAASALFEEETANDEDSDRTSGLRRETRSSTTVGRLQTLPTVLELGDITFQ
jgi:hypothetical protein